MKKTTAPKGKTKAPVKPEPALIKIWLEEQKDLDVLNTIKILTGMNVTSKAVYEALVNYPQVCKRADGLNTELQKVNREYEQLQNKMETVSRAFKIVLGTEQKAVDSKYTPGTQYAITDCPDCGADLDNEDYCCECDWTLKED